MRTVRELGELQGFWGDLGLNEDFGDWLVCDLIDGLESIQDRANWEAQIKEVEEADQEGNLHMTTKRGYLIVHPDLEWVLEDIEQGLHNDPILDNDIYDRLMEEQKQVEVNGWISRNLRRELSYISGEAEEMWIDLWPEQMLEEVELAIAQLNGYWEETLDGLSPSPAFDKMAEEIAKNMENNNA